MGRDILVVDDSGDDFEIFVIAAKVAGINRPIRWAHGGKHALEILDRERRPALILLDLEMRGADGLDFLRRLRADPRHKDTTVVILTDTFEEEQRLEANRLGCVDFLAKPAVWTGYERIAERVRFILSETERAAGRVFAS